MSTEAPRNSGTGEPIIHQRLEGGFSGFLRGFFGVSSKTQLTQQPTLGIVPLPPELSDFALNINKGIEEGLTMTQQAKLLQIEQARQSAEKSIKEKEAKERQAYQLIEGRLKVLEEVEQIAEDLRIQDRLTYINATVWEGKGQLRSISTTPESASHTNEFGWFGHWEPQVGFELVYFYRSALEERVLTSKGRSHGYNWRFVPGMESTYLRVFIKSFDGGGARTDSLSPHIEAGRVLDISSSYVGIGKEEIEPRRKGTLNLGDGYDPFVNYTGRPVGYAAFFKDYARFRLESPGHERIEEKLDQVLVNESTMRVREGAVPSKLILAGQEKLRRAKASPQWMRWEYAEEWYDGGD